MRLPSLEHARVPYRSMSDPNTEKLVLAEAHRVSQKGQSYKERSFSTDTLENPSPVSPSDSLN